MFAAYYRGSQTPVVLPNRAEVGKAENISRKYDALFAKYGNALPVPFLRALAYSESRLKPRRELDKGIDVSTRLMPDGSRDSYWGLFQVGVKNVLQGFNREHGTNIEPAQLFDPDINTMVAAWHINRVLHQYEETGRKYNIPNLIPDWDNAEFVKLLLAGWNSGHSRTGGVQAAAQWLRQSGAEVTHDNIFRYGDKMPRVTKFLTEKYKKKHDWQARVADRFYEQRGLGPVNQPSAVPLVVAALALTALILA